MFLLDRTPAAKTLAARALAACALITMSALAGCGASDHSTIVDSAPAPGGGVTQEVTGSFRTFFDGGTGAAQKIALLENGPTFADAINAQANSPMAKATTASVTTVTSTAADHADVTYSILFNGKPALADQHGAAVRQDGTWKVTAATFCALLTLEGNPPPACAASAPTPAH
ncbi:hypothetical protein [Nocardia sp. BMG111209]|uniref:hypothetical protein n=1 Tax=Nocardia sp. BMG111209 TaxID=1160137 RepID=UPI000477BF18|nr:hypothetical protein [Nocardia sp. BMG111209]